MTSEKLTGLQQDYQAAMKSLDTARERLRRITEWNRWHHPNSDTYEQALRKVAVWDASVRVRQLAKEISQVAIPHPAPETPPECWCCACIHRSRRHEGCKACHTRPDVQQWIDTTASRIESHPPHLFACPTSNAPQCPGWAPKKRKGNA